GRQTQKRARSQSVEVMPLRHLGRMGNTSGLLTLDLHFYRGFIGSNTPLIIERDYNRASVTRTCRSTSISRHSDDFREIARHECCPPKAEVVSSNLAGCANIYGRHLR